MKVRAAYEIFRLLSPSEVSALVEAACEDDEVPDKIAGAVLTYQQIPLRRFSKLSDETRRAYVRRTLRDKRASDLALFVLSAALTRRHGALIAAFLDAVNVPHEGPNLATEGPVPEPADGTLAAAIDGVLAQFSSREVALYLHAFAAQPDVDWPGLAERLRQDPRLAFEDRSSS